MLALCERQPKARRIAGESPFPECHRHAVHAQQLTCNVRHLTCLGPAKHLSVDQHVPEHHLFAGPGQGTRI